MSSEISSTSKNHQAMLNNLQKKNNREVDFVKQSHEKRVSEVKKGHDVEINNVRDENRHKISLEIDKKEKALSDLKNSLDTTQKMTETEQKRLLAHNQTRSQDINSAHQERVATIVEKNEEQIKDLNQKFNHKINYLQKETASQLSDQDERSRLELNTQKDQYTHKIQSQRKNFQATYNHESEKYDSQLDRQKYVSKKNLANTEKEGQLKLSETSKKFVKLNQKEIEHHQKSAAEREVVFENKFQNQLAKHTEIEKNLDSLHTQFLNSSKEKLTKRVTLEKERSQDPFFNFTEIKPTITKTEDGYQLRVKVPQYAKEGVTLTTNVKELVLTANRRHQDERTNESGVLQKVNKVESLVSRIPVDEVLNSRKMTKEWIDGELVFKVFKA